MCADENYIVPLAVTLRSLAESQPAAETLHVTVLSVGVSQRLQERVIASAAPLSVTFVAIDEQTLALAPPAGGLSRATYGRIVSIDLLPDDVDRVVYLDADTIVREDLDHLFSVDLEGRPVAAVQDPVAPLVSAGLPQWRSLGLAPTTPYMNSGVLLIDADVWRSRDLAGSLLDFVATFGEQLRWADQDAFNGVLAGEFTHLPLRWNQMFALRQPTHLGYATFPPREVEKAIEDPAIVHFNGLFKPWLQGSLDPATPDWLDLLSRTEFSSYRRKRSEPRVVSLARRGVRARRRRLAQPGRPRRWMRRTPSA